VQCLQCNRVSGKFILGTLFLEFLSHLVSRNYSPRTFSGIVLVDGELHNVQISSYTVAQCSQVYGVAQASCSVPAVLR